MKILSVNQWAEGSSPKAMLNSIVTHSPDMLVYYGASEARTPENDDRNEWIPLYNEIKKKGIKVYYITGGEIFLPYYSDKDTFGGRLPNCTIVSNPMYFLHQTYEQLNTSTGKEHKILFTPYPIFEFNRLFISLNNLAHTHRQHLMDYFSKNAVLNHGHISWLNRHNYNCHFKYYGGEKRILDQPFTEDMHNMWKPPVQYFKTPLNVVSESDDIIPFYTEKTWLALAFSKMFLIQGAVGMNTGLTKYGFKVFDNIIDYSFDFTQDLEERTDLLTKEVKKLEQYSYNEIWELTKETREHNRLRLIEIAKKRLFDPPHLKWLNNLPRNSFINNREMLVR